MTMHQLFIYDRWWQADKMGDCMEGRRVSMRMGLTAKNNFMQSIQYTVAAQATKF